jgi:hypothetical protein
MKQLLSVFNSDSINRYRYRFSIHALIYTLWREHDAGVPMLVAHDSLRPFGWSYPAAVHFEPGLTRLVGLGMVVENDEESEHLFQALRAFLARMAKEHEPEFNELRRSLANYLNGHEKIFLSKECVALVEEGLCSRIFPQLFASRDNDGLVPLSGLTSIGPGVFRMGEFAVFAHPYFRRSLSRMNTLNTPFLRRIQDIKSDAMSIKIAIDPDMVGLASTYGEYEELQYWWGPKFDDNLATIPEGVTHHQASETDRYFFGTSATQFWWQSRDGEHIFEAEELRDIPAVAIDGDVTFGCRYIHSRVREKTGEIVHLDGAIRMYPEEKMIERLGVDIAHAGRHTEYTKLWRIDGTITTLVWKELLSDYFRDNRLVGEYLGAVEEESFDYQISDQNPEPKSVITKYVPYSMTKGDGIRLALSYHPYEIQNDTERLVVPLDTLSSETENLRVVESWVVELRKVLVRLNASLFIPNDIHLLSFKDFYVNLPLILHSKAGMPGNLYTTLEAIKELVRAFNRRGYDQVAAYTVGFPVDGKEVRISVIGHVADLETWLSTPLSAPPTSQDEIYDWAEKVSEFLKEKYPVTYDTPPIYETLMSSGVLLTQRRRLDDRFEVKYSLAEEGLEFSFKIPDDEKPLEAALERGDIVPALAFLKLESKCTRCGQPYSVCSCSKILDKGVVEEITGSQPAFLFWTDRSV